MQWIRRHWQAAFGLALLVLPPFWKWLRQVLGVLGDVDLVVERTRDPGWIKSVIELALDPPEWLLLALALSGVAIIVWDIFLRSGPKASGKAQPCKENNQRLCFVMRNYPPFRDSVIKIPDEDAESYYTRYIGVRNLDEEKTVNNVRVQLVGGNQASSAIPMPLLYTTGESSLSLSPGEMRLIVFTRQEIKQDGRFGSAFIAGKAGARICIREKHIARLGAYGRDAYATVEFIFDFDQDNELLVRPPKVGDHPEMNEVRTHGRLSFGKQRPITPPPAEPSDNRSP